MTRKTAKRRIRGFTLSELLIALTILGVIATFTIPKVLQSQTDGKYKAIAKEAAAMVSQSLQLYKLKNGLTSGTGSIDLTPYMNHVKVDSSTVVDGNPTDGTKTCGSGNWRCLLLHNGSLLVYANDTTFGGTSTTNMMWFDIDPDGKASSNQAQTFWLYTDGRVMTYTYLLPGSAFNGGGTTYMVTADSSKEPSWFSWD